VLTTSLLPVPITTAVAADHAVDLTDRSGGTHAPGLPDLGSETVFTDEDVESVLVHGSDVDFRPGPQESAPNLAAATSVRSQVSFQALSVAALVSKAGEGEPRAWEELVARFGGMIAATGWRYRLTPADVAELQQTTWLRLVENLHKIEQPERVGGWLATTARRESLQLLRRASKYHSGADQMLANMPDMHLPEPDAGPIAEERDAVLRAAWARLKPRCQELLTLLVSDDPTGYHDVSKLLQMPVGSIGPTRARCLDHLRRLMAEEDNGDHLTSS
jgi:RNA polymerase sigma factor (sigma-70 family)